MSEIQIVQIKEESDVKVDLSIRLMSAGLQHFSG